MSFTTICSTTSTRTLYGSRTTLQPGATMTVTEVVPVAPSIRTRLITTTECNATAGGGCGPATRTVLQPIPGHPSQGTSTTRTSTTVFRGTRTTVVSFPTSTIYESTCIRTTVTVTQVSVVPTYSATSTLITTKTDPIDNSPTTTTTTALGPPKAKANIGAIVGGLIGGFMFPILVLLLIRWLRRKHLLRRNSGPTDDMRSNHSGGNLASSYLQRRTSMAVGVGPTTIPPLHRTVTISENGHPSHTGGAAAGGAALDRRLSRAGSRTSRTSYDRRGAISPSPVSSNFDYPVMPRDREAGGSVSRRSSTRPASPPVPPPPSGGGPAVPPAAVVHPDYGQRSPSPPQGYVTSSSPYDHNLQPYRRAVSPVSLSDHPYAYSSPVPTGERNGIGGGGGGAASGSPEMVTMFMSSGPSNHGHGTVLPSVEELEYDLELEAREQGEMNASASQVTVTPEIERGSLGAGRDLEEGGASTSSVGLPDTRTL
ncbi:hypothetical protein D9611_005052 [Ephemerocybe angulata]|uniref:Uncharacterized protein n=1 Tax=Ephemerocybe angulata TaxID=980116 RepID=A0A8H5B2X5_9AGAR|nr:hypothetical protein D9611_005052 [Tulosesus angulatus]